ITGQTQTQATPVAIQNVGQAPVAVTHEPAQTPAPAPVEHARGRGFVLLDGCVVTGEARVVNLAPLLRRAAELAAAAVGVPEYRMAEYGRAPGILVWHLEGLLDGTLDAAGAPVPGAGDWALLPRGPEAEH